MKSGWADWPVIRRAQTVKFNSSLQVGAKPDAGSLRLVQEAGYGTTSRVTRIGLKGPP